MINAGISPKRAVILCRSRTSLVKTEAFFLTTSRRVSPGIRLTGS